MILEEHKTDLYIRSRENCLLLLPRRLFPLVSGYSLKNYNLIEILSRNYNLTLLVIDHGEFTSEEKEFYTGHCCSYILIQYKKIKSYINIFKAFWGKEPLQANFLYDKKIQKKIDLLIEDNRVIIAGLIRMAKYINNSRKPNKTMVFDMVDSIGLNYIKSKEATNSIFWKIFYSVEAPRLLNYEQLSIGKNDITYLFNSSETKYWEKAGNVFCLPHGVNSQLFTYSSRIEGYENAVAFIGKMNYQPNVDAVLWYIKHVHSVLCSDTPLVIVGAYPTDEIKQLAGQYRNITVTGFVEDPYIYLNSCMALIAPMQTGGGIQNKVLEGMALGKNNIISSLAAKPIIGAKDKIHFLIADTPEQYISTIKGLKLKKDELSVIGAHARELILKHYTWSCYGEAYLKGISSVWKKT